MSDDLERLVLEKHQLLAGQQALAVLVGVLASRLPENRRNVSRADINKFNRTRTAQIQLLRSGSWKITVVEADKPAGKAEPENRKVG